MARRASKTAVEDGLSSAREVELARAAKLTAKQLAYFQFRGQGLKGPTAILRAGYACRTRRSATAMAHNLDLMLRDRQLLDAALLDEGITMLSFVNALKAGMRSKDPRVAVSAARYLGTILGYGQDDREPEDAPSDGYEILARLKDAVADAVRAG